MLATAMAIVSLAIFFAVNYSSDSVRISQGQNTVERLAAAAERVYALGPNSKEYVTVLMPDDIRAADVSSNRILLTVGISTGTTDVYSSAKPALIGALPTRGGKQKILVEYLPSGKVRIGEAGLSCSPQLVTWSLTAGDAGGMQNSTIAVFNNADFGVTNITAGMAGSPLALLDAPGWSDLAEGGNGTLGLQSAAVPEGQAAGIYSATLTVGSGNDGECEVQITIYVAGETTCQTLCQGGGYENGNCRPSPSDCLPTEIWMPENDISCSEEVGSPSCCCLQEDNLCPAVVSITTTQNANTAMNVTLNATCDDTGRGYNAIASAETSIDFGEWQAADTDGAYGASVALNISQELGQLAMGTHIAQIICTDAENSNCAPTNHLFNVSGLDVLGPIVINMWHSDSAPTTLAEITENATATDFYTGGNNVTACWMKVDDGDWMNATPSDGEFDSVDESFSYYVGKLQAGMHTVYAQCQDNFGNIGGAYNDTFGVKDADIALVIDRSGSMGWPTVNVTNDTIVSTTSNNFVLVKTLTMDGKDGNFSNLSIEARTSTTGCAIFYEARGPDGAVLASGSRTSTTYSTTTTQVNVTPYSTPYVVELYLKRSSSCTAYSRIFRMWQGGSKMDAMKVAGNVFVNLSANSTAITLATFASSATLNQQLTGMGSEANKTIMRNAINAIVPSGSTCLECGLNTAVDELISSRGRYPGAVRVMIFMTDGEDTVGSDPIAGAVYARENDVKIYTIGFGTDSDTVTLTNIAYLTQGIYYYAPDYETLLYIYQHIGE
jgi:hypothetical protein